MSFLSDLFVPARLFNSSFTLSLMSLSNHNSRRGGCSAPVAWPMHSHAQPVAWPRTAMPPNSSMALAGHTPKQFHGPNGPQTQAGPWPMRNHATTVVWPAMHPPANTPTPIPQDETHGYHTI